MLKKFVRQGRKACHFLTFCAKNPPPNLYFVGSYEVEKAANLLLRESILTGSLR